jgi:uncharacterized protein YuzE
MDKAMSNAQINWSTRNNLLKCKVDYNEKRDIFIAYSEDEREVISIDCDGEYWVRIDPKNGEILGIEIEDFRRVFLKKHPQIGKEKSAYIRPITDFIEVANCST